MKGGSTGAFSLASWKWCRAMAWRGCGGRPGQLPRRVEGRWVQRQFHQGLDGLLGDVLNLPQLLQGGGFGLPGDGMSAAGMLA